MSDDDPLRELSPELQALLNSNPRFMAQLEQAGANRRALANAKDLSYQVFVADGAVTVQFSEPILWVRFEAKSALGFGQAVIRTARRLMRA